MTDGAEALTRNLHSSLRDHDCPGMAQPGHSRRIVRRAALCVFHLSPAAPESGDVDPVLDGDRLAVQRSRRHLLSRGLEHLGVVAVSDAVRPRRDVIESPQGSEHGLIGRRHRAMVCRRDVGPDVSRIG